MPKFRFEFHDLAKRETAEVDLPNVEAAYAQAVQAAVDALADGVVQQIDRSASVTKVYDESGYLVATINYADPISDVRLPKEKHDEPLTEEPSVMRSG
jgi:hypothetical protein